MVYFVQRPSSYSLMLLLLDTDIIIDEAFFFFFVEGGSISWNNQGECILQQQLALKLDELSIIVCHNYGLVPSSAMMRSAVTS
mmetsp:Transcript_7221/g.12954  ORF Transcript_7221/g.12954 Transcript_7221/m.12954 type:complete len:83 (+) Transcript_7221:96-344(+)